LNRVVVALALPVLLFSACAIAEAEGPLRIRNLAPASQVFGIPRALGAEVVDAGYELTFNTEIANNFTGEFRRGAVGFFDGETMLLSVGYRRPLADRWEWGVELPYVIHDGGFLDGVVEGFHDFFGFDDNGRDLARRHQIDYYIRHDGEVFADFQRSRRDWGDARVALGYQLQEGDDRSLAVRAMVKLPTGDAGQLTGPGGTDLSVWIEQAWSGLFGRERASLSTGAGLVLLGEGEIVEKQQETFVGWGHLGLAWRLSDTVHLLGQIDYHSALIDTGLDPVAARAFQGTIGARWRVSDRFWSDFGLTEDLSSNSTSDIGFQMMLGARL